MIEEWRDVPEFEGRYQVSNLGGLRSLPRTQMNRWGTRTAIPGRAMRTNVAKSGHHRVILMDEGRRVHVGLHVLVARAFIPNPSNLPWVLHGDDDPGNNRVDNLRWGAPADNTRDSVVRSRHVNTRKTHCPQGHEYDTENTGNYGTGRVCRSCHRMYTAEAREALS